MKATGDFTLHGVTKQMTVPVTLTYLEESDKTKTRAPGDLLLLQTKFAIALADYQVKGTGGLIGSKVGESIEIDVSIVGSNAVK